MPRGKRRKYLPFGLTKEEKRSPKLRRKLASCVKRVEKKSCPRSARRKDGTYDYSKCMTNPVAICRHALKDKKSKRKKRKK